MVAGEEGPQLELVELIGQLVELVAISPSKELSASSRPSSWSVVGVGDPLREAVDEVDVLLEAGQLRGQLPRAVRVVPEIGRGRLLLELGHPLTLRVDLQVAAARPRRDGESRRGGR